MYVLLLANKCDRKGSFPFFSAGWLEPSKFSQYGRRPAAVRSLVNLLHLRMIGPQPDLLSQKPQVQGPLSFNKCCRGLPHNLKLKDHRPKQTSLNQADNKAPGTREMCWKEHKPLDDQAEQNYPPIWAIYIKTVMWKQ